jgi:hypothetical protein
MNYQVWTQDDYKNWVKKDCPDMGAAQAELLVALKAGKEPLLTIEVAWTISIDINEAPELEKLSASERWRLAVGERGKGVIGETTEGKAEPNQGAVAQGDGAVR